MSSDEHINTCAIEAKRFQADLLAWYDANKREMPWRAPTGERPAPYHVWLSEVMLQQTTVAAVQDYFRYFIDKWPDIHALANADRNEVMQAWAGLGYYTRARNLHKCAGVVATAYDGQFPADEKELQKLPGIGPYTAAAIAAIAFDKPAAAIDGNVERVGARLFDITTPLPGAKSEFHAHVRGLYDDVERPGDFVQAMMELGATICRPRSPLCMLCPVRQHCHAYQAGRAAQLPARQPKKAKPHKYGYVYTVRNRQGEYLFETRPQNTLLGGMPGLPHSTFDRDINACQPPAFINDGLAETDGPEKDRHFITHSFTHFDLTLYVCTGTADKNRLDCAPYYWVEPANYTADGLPRLFQKVVQSCPSL